MPWRDDIAERARNGDVDGVLKIFDELDYDRQRVRAINEAYLAEIRGLKGATKPSAGTVQALRGACTELRGLLSAIGAARD